MPACEEESLEKARKMGIEIFLRMVSDGVDLDDDVETEAAFEHAIEQYPLGGSLGETARAVFLDCVNGAEENRRFGSFSE